LVGIGIVRRDGVNISITEVEIKNENTIIINDVFIINTSTMNYDDKDKLLY